MSVSAADIDGNTLVTIDLDIMSSSLLRGTVLGNCNTVLSLSKIGASSLDFNSLNKLIINHFKNIVKNDPNNNEIKKLLHYLNSKKLRVLIFRKSKSKSEYVPLETLEDFICLKFALKVKKRFKFILVFVKISTFNYSGYMSVKNAVLDKIQSESNEINNVNEKTLKNENQLFDYYNENINPFDDSKVIENSNIDSFNLQFNDNIINLIKSYLDPLNTSFDKKISNILDHINDLKDNLSNSIEPINEKLDDLYGSLFLNNSNQNSSNDNNNNNNLIPRCNITHSFILCDGCDKTITGFRFKCVQCEDFDLCETCDLKNFESSNHLKTHQMLRIFLDEKPVVPNINSNFKNGDIDCYSYITANNDIQLENNFNTDNNDLFNAKISIENDKILLIELNSKLNYLKILLNVTFKGNYILPIEGFEIDVKSFKTVFHLDLSDRSIAENISIFDIDTIYLNISSNSKEYVFKCDENIDEFGKLNGTFILMNDDNNIEEEVEEVEEVEESNFKAKNTLSNDLKVSNDIINPISNLSEFKLLGYYILDFNTNDLEVKVKYTESLSSEEYISLSILTFEDSTFTSILQKQDEDIFTATFPNWKYKDFLFNVKEVSINCKSGEFKIFPDTHNDDTSQHSSLESDSSLSTNKSSLLFPQLEAHKEQDYVIISGTESLVDDNDNESDYSILSVEDI